MKEIILDCIYTTRETCNELRPPFLVELGLIESIKVLINKIHLQANFYVQFEVYRLEDDDLHDEYMIALYRIVPRII